MAINNRIDYNQVLTCGKDDWHRGAINLLSAAMSVLQQMAGVMTKSNVILLV